MEVSSTNHRAWLSGEAEHSAEPGGKSSLPQGTRATLTTSFLPPQSQNKIGKGYWFRTEMGSLIKLKKTFLFVLKVCLLTPHAQVFESIFKITC